MSTRTVEAPPATPPSERAPSPAVSAPPQPNPLREGLRHERMAEPCTMVICGATGDLTERKLAPALYNAFLGGFLPPEFTVVGFARRGLTDTEFREHLLAGINKYSRNRPVKPAIWDSIAAAIEYHRGDFNDPGAYAELAARLDRIDRDRGTAGNRLFYLAVPPSLYPEIVNQLDRAGLAASGPRRRTGAKRGWTRVIVEKPFGYDLASAQTLNREIAEVFDEDQVYRIDHYLGKETVQNLSVFRFGSSRSGTAATSTRCRSPWPRPSGSRGAASSTTTPARCVTSSRTMASS
jgi:glucose-6-phosphate 1-dehydrogenase